jgi:hypothetical protein
MKMQSFKLSDEIRRAVDASGLSRYRISKTLGIAESTMSRFMSGGGLSMKSIDTLAEVLDLHLKAGNPRQLSAKRKTGKKR